MQFIELCREEPHDGEIPFEARPVGPHELKPYVRISGYRAPSEHGR